MGERTGLKPVKGLAALMVAGVLALGPGAYAQTRTTHVSDNIYMITGAGGNVTVSVGSSGIMLVDSGSATMSDALLTAIQEIDSNATIRFIVNTTNLPEHVGGNATVRIAGDTFTGGNATNIGGIDVGASIVAHETALHRMAAVPGIQFEMLPTDTFFTPKYDLYFNGEPVEMIHQPSSIDDTSLVVHFRRADVISAGDVFRLDGYPRINLEYGGSINGVLDSLNFLVDLAISDTLSEGGTLIIPGHGRITDEGDLVRYRDAMTIVRDRVQAMIDRGQTLDEVIASRPSLTYDSRYSLPDWTTEMFLGAVYESLTIEAGQASR